MAARGRVTQVNVEKAITSRRDLITQLEKEIGALETVVGLMKSQGQNRKATSRKDAKAPSKKKGKRKRGRGKLSQGDREKILDLVFRKKWASKRVAEKMRISVVSVQKVCRDAGRPIPRGRGKKKR